MKRKKKKIPWLQFLFNHSPISLLPWQHPSVSYLYSLSASSLLLSFLEVTPIRLHPHHSTAAAHCSSPSPVTFSLSAPVVMYFFGVSDTFLTFYFLLYFLLFNYSCLHFHLTTTPTPPILASHPRTYPLWFCPCVLYRCSWKPFPFFTP